MKNPSTLSPHSPSSSKKDNDNEKQKNNEDTGEKESGSEEDKYKIGVTIRMRLLTKKGLYLEKIVVRRVAIQLKKYHHQHK